MKAVFVLFPCALVCFGLLAPAQSPDAGSPLMQKSADRATYVLGPGDQISIRVLEVEEINDKPVRIDLSGYVRLPLVGRVRAGGLTVEQFEANLTRSLTAYVRKPDVSVAVTEYHSQPVSVIGAVKTPGVHQLEGRKTLIEILSMAGGLDVTAGPKVKITRRAEWGPIPLATASRAQGGDFSVAEVNLKDLIDAQNPECNIVILPHDVISVPRAEMIYVVGQVLRSGGYVLNEHEAMTVLQALTLAGGLDRTASPKNARILRSTAGAAERTEISVNLQKILEGKGADLPMRPEDILFVPTSTPKKAAIRAIETAIQIGTGVVIWRR
ncbi:MAG: polysaccharide export protein [Acidobacteria bacterium]|nr:polysaccharide export protein [Acidobacteriota bacterium]MCL5742715.1 polysaccharide export protein [Acidobacteriota bacterium]